MFLLTPVLIMTVIRGVCPVEYKIGMIVQKECCAWHAMYKVGGAINIALDQLREDHVIDNVTFRYLINIVCFPKMSHSY